MADVRRPREKYKHGNYFIPEEYMNKDPKNIRFVWLALAAILSLFVGGKWNIPLAAWLAPVFAIRFYRDSEKGGRAFLWLWLTSAIPAIISWQGATFMHFVHPAVEAIFFALITPISLIPYAIDRAYHRRFPQAVWLTLIYPIAATGMDFFSASGSPFGTFGAAAYSQRDFLPLMQIVSVTGLWGITFVFSWFASVVNHVWEHGLKGNRIALTFACVLTLILGLGFGRTLSAAPAEQTAQVAGFSLPVGKMSQMLDQIQAGDGAGFRQTVDELHAMELDQIRTFAQEGAEIVSLQEGAGMGHTDQVEKFLADATMVADEENIYIILPTFDLGKQPPENIVRIIDPNGEIVLEHIKYGGTQFEGSLAGSGILQTVDTPYGKLSAVICWDADFPNPIKQAGEQNVDLLFIPSNDWNEVRDIHAGMAVFRAVENGMSIFRQTGQGVSVVTDAYGREYNHPVDVFEEETTGSFAAKQIVQTPIGSVNTIYPAVGDMIGNVMLIATLGLVVILWIKRKK
jgi:apolipoprotein N-acyltransferase